jgi:hypothetical protein
MLILHLLFNFPMKSFKGTIVVDRDICVLNSLTDVEYLFLGLVLLQELFVGPRISCFTSLFYPLIAYARVTHLDVHEEEILREMILKSPYICWRPDTHGSHSSIE